MAKRKEIDVDEDLIKSMMTGDIPRLNQQLVKEKEIPEKEKETEIPVVETPAEKETVPSKPRRRREVQSYASLFLKKDTGAKRQTYISSALYDKVSKILGIIAKDVSVPNFVDNVLENHLKEYRDEINEMYRNNTDLFL